MLNGWRPFGWKSRLFPPFYGMKFKSGGVITRSEEVLTCLRIINYICCVPSITLLFLPSTLPPSLSGFLPAINRSNVRTFLKTHLVLPCSITLINSHMFIRKGPCFPLPSNSPKYLFQNSRTLLTYFLYSTLGASQDEIQLLC
jgi:hypothetical protein